jgi:competence protein ComEC
VLRVDYGENSVLLTADIEGEAETALLEQDFPVNADILKVAHHGGDTSTCEAFLKAVDPQFAVISVGKGNKHGHPHAGPLSNLKNRNVMVYRTDLYGNITAVSDGHGWTFKVSKAR